MHTIASAYLQHEGHRQLKLIYDHPSSFSHQALRNPIPVGNLSIGATFFAVGFGPRRERSAREPDSAGEARGGLHIDDVEAVGEVLKVFVCWHTLGCRPCALYSVLAQGL